MVACILSAIHGYRAAKLTTHRMHSDIDFQMYVMWHVFHERRNPQRHVPLELLSAIMKPNSKMHPHGLSPKVKLSLVGGRPRTCEPKQLQTKNEAKVQEGSNNDGLTKAH